MQLEFSCNLYAFLTECKNFYKSSAKLRLLPLLASVQGYAAQGYVPQCEWERSRANKLGLEGKQSNDVQKIFSSTSVWPFAAYGALSIVVAQTQRCAGRKTAPNSRGSAVRPKR